jgi:hypothetical protein
MSKEDNENLTDLPREELNDVAENQGVENPEKLPNKEAVANAISEKSWSVNVTPTDIYHAKASSYQEAVKLAEALHKKKGKK